jgi:hypothetical protein
VDVYGAIQATFEGGGLSTKLMDLTHETKYLIWVAAVTVAGVGSEYLLEDETLPNSSEHPPSPQPHAICRGVARARH